MGRILLIEGSPDGQFLARRALEDVAEVILAGNLLSAKHLLAANKFDVLIVDVQAPDEGSYELCSELIASHDPSRPRIVFLTGLSDLADKLTAFNRACDDYVVKPVDPLELRARVQVQLRGCREEEPGEKVLRAGNLRLNLSTRSAKLGDGLEPEELELTPTEFKILQHLARHPGQVFSREELLEAVRGGSKIHVIARTIDAHICRVRKKLSACTYGVEPIYGVGYRLTKKAAA